MSFLNRVQVFIRRFPQWDNKEWVVARLENGGEFVPSFYFLWDIIRHICICEDKKYPDGEGRGMVQRFVSDCCDPEMTYKQLQDKFEIPNRKARS